jgi:hypothetical protein
LKCDGTRAEIRFRFSAKRRVHLNRRGASVQSTTGSRGLHISGSNAGYTMLRGSVKSTGYPLHSPVSPSLPPLCHRVPSHFNLTSTSPLYLPPSLSLPMSLFTITFQLNLYFSSVPSPFTFPPYVTVHHHISTEPLLLLCTFTACCRIRV